MPPNTPNAPDHPRALVGNAADAGQVRAATTTEKHRREQELADLRVVLGTPEGRRVMWRLCTWCRTFESIFAEPTRLAYNSGRQDVGHFLLDELTQADPTALMTMIAQRAGGQ